MTTPSVGPDRSTLRERERETRRRRLARLETLRETVAALELAVPVVLTLGQGDDDDDDSQWEYALDPKAVRVRRLMRKSIALTAEAQRLTSTRNQLRRLIHEHQVASRVLAGMLHASSPLDEWKADVERWEVIARRHYKPRTIEDCQELMDVALKEEQAFQWSTEKQSTGMSFMGWRDSRRVDHARGAFQFQFEKTFHGYDMKEFVKLGWDTYTEAATFYDILIGPRARAVDGVAIGERVCAVHHVVQELSPTMLIVRNVEQYPEGPVNVHMVDMVCRVPTERGFIQCVRSVHCPELIKAFDDPGTVWSSNAIWLVWERLEEDDMSYTFRIGGSLVGNDMTYLSQWMLEGLGCVLRCERIVRGRPLLTFGQ